MNRNECFTFMAGPSQSKLFVWIHDYKTLGKDKLLGSGEVEVGCFDTFYFLASADWLVGMATCEARRVSICGRCLRTSRGSGIIASET